MNTETKICQNCKNEFLIEPDDFAFYERINVPPPTWCPECRMIRRMVWRNERTLYRRPCDLCKKSIIAMYDQKEPGPVYCHECWFSDDWDPMSYGKDYDFSRPFFAQWKELFDAVPKFNVYQIRANSACDFVNYAADSKNCYLGYSLVGCENVMYSYATDRSNDCLDCTYLKDSSLCYENTDGVKNYNSTFLIDCQNCINSHYLYDCVNCQDCVLSSNLRNKRYVIENKQYSKEEYFAKRAELGLASFAGRAHLRVLDADIRTRRALHKYASNLNAAGCTGDHIENSKQTTHSFQVYEMDSVKDVIRAFRARDSRDVFGTARSELMYECVSSGYDGSRNSFSAQNDGCRDVRYVAMCANIAEAFGCVGLRKKSYCILNKQYSKEAYTALVRSIIEHMMSVPYRDATGREYRYGELFPPESIPFAYNESIAQEYFPLTKDEALAKGFRWKEPEVKQYQVTKNSGDLPDKIEDVDDAITNEVIQCASVHGAKAGCTTAFRIVPAELQFYRQMNLPLPRLCPNCRHYERLQQRNPLKLWKRRCLCQVSGVMYQDEKYRNTGNHFHGEAPCSNEFETPYSPERMEIVYCEACYNAEIV